MRARTLAWVWVAALPLVGVVAYRLADTMADLPGAHPAAQPGFWDLVTSALVWRFTLAGTVGLGVVLGLLYRGRRRAARSRGRRAAAGPRSDAGWTD
ncbi:MAG: hypothetical protein U5R31_14960 [Acidimicrobiia bacterium]|nr:hypothetical protein [Acidimicrobiia bacterium]